MVSCDLRLLLAHDHANAAPPALRQGDANHFDLGRQSVQQSVGHRMETQGGSNQINQWGRFLNVFITRRL